MKKVLSFLLIAMLTLSIFIVPAYAIAAPELQPPHSMKFKDINYYDWYADSVYEATEKLKLFSGIAEDCFQPQGKMTRGMFVTVLGKMAKVDTSKYKSQKFNDVPDTAYYAPYANWAAETGLLSGTGDQKFSPDMPIIREHACTILYRYTSKNNLILQEYDKTPAKFEDVGNLSELSKTSINKLYAATVVSGQSETSFAPEKEITRAEAAVLFVTANFVFSGENEVHQLNLSSDDDTSFFSLTLPNYWHGRCDVTPLIEHLDKGDVNDEVRIVKVIANYYKPKGPDYSGDKSLFTLFTVKEDGKQIQSYLDRGGEFKSDYELINKIKFNDIVYFVILTKPNEAPKDREYIMLESAVSGVIDSIEYIPGVEVLS